MRFNDLDKKMRIYETANDTCVLPNIYMTARIDGRSFTRLTKEVHKFEAPYDIKFRDMMVETVKHLMNCGFNIIYGYTQSDEISLLFNLDESTFNRKERKINSILAGEASAKFSLLLNDLASFDCRISQLPTIKLVVDYFRWRSEDALRNALNAHCYWQLRKDKLEPSEASKELSGLSVSDKNELLFRRGINFNEIPNWQKRGVGICWGNIEKNAINQKTKESVIVKRRVLKSEYELPTKGNYSEYITKLVDVGYLN